MDTAPIYDLTEQLERIAGALEKMTDSEKNGNNLSANLDSDEASYLSKFLEILPNWHYNCLRRKLLPASLAAKLLGLSPYQLSQLTQNGQIKNNGGRYDVLGLLMWLDENATPRIADDFV